MGVTDGSAVTSVRRETVERILALGAVAVVRLRDASAAERVIDALAEGGVRAIEVTVTVPGAIRIIEAVARRRGDELVVGVGSVLDAATARDAVSAGARYVVSPVFVPAVVEAAHAAGVPAMPGAFTPTEILRAHEGGADVVKVFPADVLGTAFFKGVLAPMPFLRLMPTGGVTPDNVGDWLRAGAAAVGLGGALVDERLVAAGDFAAITARAQRVVAGVAAARAAAAERAR